MRFAARLVGVLLLCVGLVSCDKAQIAQLESQTVTITVSVVGTDAELFNVWNLIQDNNMDNVPDDGMTYLWCKAVPVGMNQPPRMISVQPPWHHSLRISVLRADSTSFEQVTDDMYLNVLSNLSPYDSQVLFGNTASQTNPLIVMGQRFVFSNPRQMSSVNRTVLLATSNPVTSLDSTTYGYKNGLCSVSMDPGPSMMAGAPQPFTFELGKGDTIRVEARKALNPPMGLRDGQGNRLTVIEPVIVGRLAVDGVNIGSLGGDPSSSTMRGDGFSFFYSSR